MGNNVQPDRGVTIEIMLKLQVLFDHDWTLATSDNERLELSQLACFILLGIAGGLRGKEIAKAELAATLKHLDNSLVHPRKPHVTLALQGRVKGERNKRCHLLPLALVTHSELKVGEWLCTLDVFASKGVNQGPIFQVDRQGKASRGSVADFKPWLLRSLR
jgi:hypothetical protein